MIIAASHARFNLKRALGALAMVVIATTTAGCDETMGPLQKAAATGDVQLVKSWIAAKRNLDVTYDEPSTGLEGNYSRRRGVTALMIAARMGRVEIVKLLVEGGANLYAESRLRDGSDPRNAFDDAVDKAAEDGRMGAVEYLWTRSDGIRFAKHLEHDIATSCTRSCDDKFGSDSQRNPALFLISVARDDAVVGKGISQAACYSQQPLRLLNFLDRHAVRFSGGAIHCMVFDSTVRHVHSLETRIAMASFLLDRGANIEDPGVGYTPLMGAASAHEIGMVKFLLARGANPNTPYKSGITAIGLAANTCVLGNDAPEVEPRMVPQLQVIEYLAQSGADRTLYASEDARSKLTVLTSCCKRQPQSGTQRRICEVFGL
jgi:ankyrin repeat protein